jgi:hypothetical protein
MRAGRNFDFTIPHFNGRSIQSFHNTISALFRCHASRSITDDLFNDAAFDSRLSTIWHVPRRRHFSFTPTHRCLTHATALQRTNDTECFRFTARLRRRRIVKLFDSLYWVSGADHNFISVASVLLHAAASPNTKAPEMLLLRSLIRCFEVSIHAEGRILLLMLQAASIILKLGLF